MISGDMLAALDPVVFAKSLGIMPDEWQAEVLRAEDKRMLLNCCRQSGKSTTTAIKALHTAVYRPNSLILLGSPSMRQSQELFRKIQGMYGTMKDKPQLLEDNKLSCTFANQSRIISLPGEPGTIRGYSNVALFIEDEAAQVQDGFYQAILPMLIVSEGTFIAMSTPFGKRGHFFEEWTAGGDAWRRIEVTAEECPRITPEQLERQRRSIGDLFFRQEFLCEFVDDITTTFNYDIIQRAFDDSIEPLF